MKDWVPVSEPQAKTSGADRKAGKRKGNKKASDHDSSWEDESEQEPITRHI